jgi:hypothetical protein
MTRKSIVPLRIIVVTIFFQTMIDGVLDIIIAEGEIIPSQSRIKYISS